MLKKLECPVCKAEHELEIPEGKMIYRCPKCKLTVRCMPPQEIKVPEMKSKSEAKRVKIQVDSAKDIPEKVAEEVKKKADEVLKEKPKAKKTTRRKKKTSSKKKSGN